MNVLLRLYAYVVLLVSYITMMITFIRAYFQPTKNTLVTINDYGEAKLEIILLALSIPVILMEMKNVARNE